MATADDLRFGRKKTKVLAYDRHIHYQGTWTYGARERYREAVAERLKALKALAAWRGQADN